MLNNDTQFTNNNPSYKAYKKKLELIKKDNIE